MEGPLVSIIIPTYKRADKLERAVKSALTQTYKNIEIIVVDDNGDGTPARKETETVMAQFENKDNVLYLKHLVNRNGAAARNTGIKASKGKYISFMDDDDEYMPERIQMLVGKMESLDDSWGVCYTGYIKYLKNNAVIYGKENIEGEAYLHALMRNIFIGAGSNLFVRKKVVDEINGYNEAFRRNQDIEFLLRILKSYKIAYIKECLLIVHYEIRDRVLSYQELLEVDKLYFETFKDQIQSLQPYEKKKFFQMAAINQIRSALRRKQIKTAVKNFIHSPLTVSVLVKYFFYLGKRYITKTSYGFKF